MKRKIIISSLALIILLLAVVPSFAAMGDYCIIPPYVKRDVKPNIYIVMDNSEGNGEAAYIGGTTQVETGPNVYYYDSTEEYYGYFKSDKWYSYDGGKFVPDSSGLYDGNLLNWVTTSKYDLIQAILVGGKATSRQTNVNTLVGYNAGSWDSKLYAYTGTDGNDYVCQFDMNVGDSGDLTISDNTYYFGLVPSQPCGLLLETPVGPATGDYYTKVAAIYNEKTRYAGIIDKLFTTSNAGEKDTPLVSGLLSVDSLKRKALGAINTMMSSIATPAYALNSCTGKAVTVDTPNNGASLPDLQRYETYSDYFPVASGGCGFYQWSVSSPTGCTGLCGLPTGLSIDTSCGTSNSGRISGSTTGSPGAYSVRLTVSDYTDGTCTTLEDSPDYVDVTLQVTGEALVITTPSSGDSLSDAVRYMEYGGHVANAEGGMAPYTWSVSGFPAGIGIDADTGVIFGTPTASAGTYNATITVTDYYSESTSVNVTIIVQEGLQIVSEAYNGWLTSAVRGKFYNGAQFRVTGGSGNYSWFTIGVPGGLSIASSGSDTGKISGVLFQHPYYYATTFYWYNPSFYVAVTDNVTGITVARMYSMYIFEYIPPYGYSIVFPWQPGNNYVLPSVTRGEPYNGYTLAGVYGSGTITWHAEVPSGCAGGYCGLPAGITMDMQTGFISGTTTAPAGTYRFYAYVEDPLYGTSKYGHFYIVVGNDDLSITGPTSSEALPDAVQGGLYDGTSATATGGSGSYTWSASSPTGCTGLCGLPSGMTMNSATGYISGLPTSSIGTYSVRITVSDGYNTEFVDVSLEVLDPADVVEEEGVTMSSQTYNVRVCAGDYTNNCSTISPDPDNPLKAGIIQDFWTQAFFGLADFNNNGTPNVSTAAGCFTEPDPADPDDTADSNFLTDIQNAVPVPSGNITQLVNAEYQTIQMFKSSTNPCDPFDKSYDAYENECMSNYILMLTDGTGADTPTSGASVFSTTSSPALPTDCQGLTYNLSTNACYGTEIDVRSDLDGTQKVDTYIVHVYPPGEETTYHADILQEAANKGGGIYYPVTDPSTLRDTLILAFQDIIRRAASGTAASVLASGEGSGANLVQAVYYPKKRFLDSATGTETEITWLGRLSNFWYYVDPYFENSNIREETDGNNILHLINDYIAEFYFDTTTERVYADRYQDTDGDGDADAYDPPYDVEFEALGNLWEAGTKLWQRDIVNSPRTIYTNITNTSFYDSARTDIGATQTLAIFNTATYNALGSADKATWRTYLQAGVSNTVALDIIKYTHGEDISGYRNRTVKVDLNNDDDTDDPGEGTARTWKLGDVVNSTPRIVSWLEQNQYKDIYSDSTYASFISNATVYEDRGMIFTGSNDGLLHGFKLGSLELDWAGQGAKEKARLTGSNLGEEIWAFIPKNALPYLNYVMDSSYCHVFTIDLSPYIVDASIGKTGTCLGDTTTDYWDCEKTENSWRTVLIGGMRFGGACKDSPTANGVATPVAGVGYSSYFALDITDPEAPKFMWEFNAGGQIGFTTPGPSVVKVSPKQGDTNGDSAVNNLDEPDNTKNGRWFVVIPSGPTGPIDTTYQQFKGYSDQELKLFVLDLRTGQLLRTIGTGITEAFAGSAVDSSLDADLDYQDDAMFLGYTKKDTSTGTWTQGGVGRLLTYESHDDLTKWRWVKLIDNIGSVTSAVVNLQDTNTGKLWLYFGSGRFFYEISTEQDDPTNARHLFGVTDPCYQGSPGASAYPFLDETTCTDTLALTTGTYPNLENGDLNDVSDLDAQILVTDSDGWFIQLDDSGSYTYPDNGVDVTQDYGAERVITDPISTTTGVVYFTTYKPYSDSCALGGKSFIWATEYSTGGDPGALLKGSALIQVSTGAIEKVDLSTQFTDRGGRKSTSMEGVPPTAQGFSMFLTPAPEERIIHMKERK